MKTLIIKNIINSDIAASAEQGEFAYQHILKELERKELVTINFEGIKLLTIAFLNTAIGQLYARFNTPFLKRHIVYTQTGKLEENNLTVVIKRAKEFYAGHNPGLRNEIMPIAMPKIKFLHNMALQEKLDMVIYMENAISAENRKSFSPAIQEIISRTMTRYNKYRLLINKHEDDITMEDDKLISQCYEEYLGMRMVEANPEAYPHSKVTI